MTTCLSEGEGVKRIPWEMSHQESLTSTCLHGFTSCFNECPLGKGGGEERQGSGECPSGSVSPTWLHNLFLMTVSFGRGRGEG